MYNISGRSGVGSAIAANERRPRQYRMTGPILDGLGWIKLPSRQAGLQLVVTYLLLDVVRCLVAEKNGDDGCMVGDVQDIAGVVVVTLCQNGFGAR